VPYRYALAVSASYTHTCALLSDHTVACWGYNAHSELGNGTTTDSPTPVAVSGLKDVTAITAQNFYTCALLKAGTVACWGDNRFGELGDGTTVDSATPVAVSGVVNAIDVGGGFDGFQMCAVLAGGSVDCWGFSNGAFGWQAVTGAVALSRGEGSVECALLGTGHIDCWGNNYCGEIGDGKTNEQADSSTLPSLVETVTDAKAVAVGDFFTCALVGDGTVECWGQTFGQPITACTCFGGQAPCSTEPFSILTGATTVAAGAYHACARLEDGSVECWGDNTNGGLGDGTTTYSPTPVRVGNITDAVDVTVGGYHTCALLSGGVVECWGANKFGQLGDGTTNDSGAPVPVSF